MANQSSKAPLSTQKLMLILAVVAIGLVLTVTVLTNWSRKEEETGTAVTGAGEAATGLETSPTPGPAATDAGGGALPYPANPTAAELDQIENAPGRTTMPPPPTPAELNQDSYNLLGVNNLAHFGLENFQDEIERRTIEQVKALGLDYTTQTSINMATIQTFPERMTAEFNIEIIDANYVDESYTGNDYHPSLEYKVTVQLSRDFGAVTGVTIRAI